MCDLKLAEGLCDLLGSSIEPSTASNYRCGFRSLMKFCRKVNASPLPVSAVTLRLWMFKICGRKRKPATVTNTFPAFGTCTSSMALTGLSPTIRSFK